MSLSPGSLLLYKGRPACLRRVDKKLLIELPGGETIAVRPKDVALLHPGPWDGSALKPPPGDPVTAWELLAGGETTLPELAELIYGAFEPAGAWAVWELVADGLYFSGAPETIRVHDATTVAAIEAARRARAEEEAAWRAFVARAAAGQIATEDERYLADVVALALGRADQSRVLRDLGRSQDRETAHAFLLAAGYWNESVNPYPARFGLDTNQPAAPFPDLPDESRRDLTHLQALAIDDAGNRDPDDALSVDEDGRFWVHIADVAALVPPDSGADLEARNRGANLYLPEGAVNMLPPAATAALGLGLQDVSPALSFGLKLNAGGDIADLEIVPSWVRVDRLSYEDAETMLGMPSLNPWAELSERRLARRLAGGAVEINLPEVKVTVDETGRVAVRPLPSLRSRDLVREAMLLVGEAVGRFAQAQGLPMPYTTQSPPSPLEAVEEGMAGDFARRRAMQRSQQQSAPGRHAGLGLDVYVQCTSPLRRYLDLVAHQQLRAFLRGQPPLDAQALMLRVAAADAISGEVRAAERLSVRHWTLVYLLQNPNWRGRGVVVEQRPGRDLIILPDLALETELYRRPSRPLNSFVEVAVDQVDLATLTARFRPAT